MHYYYKKYPYLNYKLRDWTGFSAVMFSIPVARLVKMYEARMGHGPQSFFDCGAATGELVRQADELGLDVGGIEIKKYPIIPKCNKKYFSSGQIKIGSILNSPSVVADLAYCNGTLTYMNEQTLPLVLEKFNTVDMLIAIHNTSEDVLAAARRGDRLVHFGEDRLIRPHQWWMNMFKEMGFIVDYDKEHGCYCVMPGRLKQRMQLLKSR